MLRASRVRKTCRTASSVRSFFRAGWYPWVLFFEPWINSLFWFGARSSAWPHLLGLRNWFGKRIKTRPTVRAVQQTIAKRITDELWEGERKPRPPMLTKELAYGIVKLVFQMRGKEVVTRVYSKKQIPEFRKFGFPLRTHTKPVSRSTKTVRKPFENHERFLRKT